MKTKHSKQNIQVQKYKIAQFFLFTRIYCEMDFLEDDSFDEVLASMDMPGGSSEKQKPSTSETDSCNKIKTPNVNAVQVNSNQRGNPVLKSITSVPWEFNSQIIPDYVVGRTSCVLFLSIRYHNLKPEYINDRLKLLGKSYELRVLLVHVDIKEPQNALKHLTRVCLLADLT